MPAGSLSQPLSAPPNESVKSCFDEMALKLFTRTACLGGHWYWVDGPMQNGAIDRRMFAITRVLLTNNYQSKLLKNNLMKRCYTYVGMHGYLPTATCTKLAVFSHLLIDTFNFIYLYLRYGMWPSLRIPCTHPPQISMCHVCLVDLSIVPRVGKWCSSTLFRCERSNTAIITVWNFAVEVMLCNMLP